jgi:hypothetical protein
VVGVVRDFCRLALNHRRPPILIEPRPYPSGQLLRVLVLGTNRRRRFSGVVPIWLAYDSGSGELRLREERGGVTAGLPALGTWPAAGATVNLFPLRRAVEAASKENIELIAIDEAVLVPTAQGHVSLPLLVLVLPVLYRRPAHARTATRMERSVMERSPPSKAWVLLRPALSFKKPGSISKSFNAVTANRDRSCRLQRYSRLRLAESRSR